MYLVTLLSIHLSSWPLCHNSPVHFEFTCQGALSLSKQGESRVHHLFTPAAQLLYIGCLSFARAIITFSYIFLFHGTFPVQSICCGYELRVTFAPDRRKSSTFMEILSSVSKLQHTFTVDVYNYSE